MNATRLHHLIDILRRAHADQRPFDMDHWRQPPDAEDASCCTAHCAFGLAARDPDFQVAGLFFKYNTPGYLHFVGYVAAKRFFDLSFGETFYIFSPTSYDSRPRIPDVIERIEDVLGTSARVFILSY